MIGKLSVEDIFFGVKKVIDGEGYFCIIFLFLVKLIIYKIRISYII